MGKLLRILALAMAATTVTAFSAADFMPYRFQTGEMYREAKEQSEVNLQDNGRFVNTTANYFDQFIRHSNPSLGTFKQRFYVDFTYWDGKGPAALYISGEQIAKGSPSGFLQDYAQSINALLFTLEHRWYGSSNLSTNYTDIPFLASTLSVESALRDMDYFMTYIEQQFIGKNLTWFSVGGSYAGGLSAWLKVQYPNRLAAAWSSSGVVNPKFDYWQYEGHVVSVLPPLCTYSLQQVYQQIYAKWNDPVAFAALQVQFGVSNMTQTDFAEMLGDAYSGPVQYGKKVALCDAMVPLQADAIAQFAQVNKVLNGPEYGPRFMAYRNINGANAGATQDMSGWLWNFQCCTQLAYWQIGYPSIGTTSTCIRPDMINTDYYMNICARDYGAQYFPDVFAFNQWMGGATPNAENVIALQGSDDPFGPAGVNQQVNDNYPFVLAQCDGCGHCGDLYAQAPTDPPGKVQQRQMIVQYMNKWLGFVNNVTFGVASTATQASVQASLLAALPQQTWLSALIYECNLGNSQCYATFTNATVADIAIDMANAGNISGVTSGEHSHAPKPSSGGLSRGDVIGIVIGGVMAFFIILAIIALVIRHRQKKEALNGYHNVNAETFN